MLRIQYGIILPQKYAPTWSTLTVRTKLHRKKILIRGSGRREFYGGIGEILFHKFTVGQVKFHLHFLFLKVQLLHGMTIHHTHITST